MGTTRYVLTSLGRRGGLSALRGLGALPVYPPSNLLGAGKNWLRYLVSPDMQWTSCPPGAQYGCTLYGGYAWGQTTSLEFNFVYITPTTQTSTGSAAVATETDEERYTRECSAALSDWYNTTPEAKCLDQDRQLKLLEWCVAWKSGDMPTYGSEKAALVEKACREAECTRLYDQWAAAFPAQAVCLSTADRRDLKDLCYKGLKGTLSGPEVDQQIKDIIETACAAYNAPAPPSTVVPPTIDDEIPGYTPTPPGTEPGYEPSDVIPEGDLYDLPGTQPGPYGPTEPTAPTEEPSLLRQLGPIVGIGLIAAVGLTLFRKKKKLTKHRKRK